MPGNSIVFKLDLRHAFAILIALASLGLPARGDELADACGKPASSEPASTDEQVRAFGRAFVQSVRTDLRTAIMLSERNAACFRGDAAWFAANQLPWDQGTQDQCSRRTSALTEIAAANLPLLRMDLALADVSLEGDSHDTSYADLIPKARVEEWLKRQPWQFDHFLTREITHRYRGMAKLDPLTPDEIRRAMTKLDEVAAEFKTVAPADRARFFDRQRLAFRKDYKQIIAQNPFLGFLPHPVASADEVVASLDELARRARTTLARIEATYYQKGQLVDSSLTIDNLIDLTNAKPSLVRLVRAEPKSCALATDVVARANSKHNWQTLGMIVGAVAATAGCEFLRWRMPGLRFVGLCAPVVGLAFTAEGLINAELDYRAALNGVLESPYGWSALNDLDQLDSYQFDAALNWTLAPFTSGVPVMKYLSRTFVERVLSTAAARGAVLRRCVGAACLPVVARPATSH